MSTFFFPCVPVRVNNQRLNGRNPTHEVKVYPRNQKCIQGISGELLLINYGDRDLDDNPIPRKPQYGMLYRLEELDDLFQTYGWPRDRWKSEPGWEHDLYAEAQIWSDEHLRGFMPSTETD